ncbi:hypothetical protein [Streptomyces parvulus]
MHQDHGARVLLGGRDVPVVLARAHVDGREDLSGAGLAEAGQPVR